MQLCDSHCHLESVRFDNDRSEVIRRARDVGISLMVSCGSDLSTSRQQVELASCYPFIRAAVGIHGHQANSAVIVSADGTPICNANLFAGIRQLAACSEVVALGELGLDYHYEFSPRQVQRVVLQRQLEMALELNMPVILHNRESDEDLMNIVGNYPVHGVLHCFLGGSELLDWALERGLYIGIAGPITYPHMEKLHQLLTQVPLERLLVETDSPYLAPQAVRGRRNEPANIRYIVDQLAQVLGITAEKVAEFSYTNAKACFGVYDAA